MPTYTDFVQTPDSLHLYAAHWIPDKVRGVVVIVHGIGEHVRRYEHVARAFMTQGLAVFGLDQRGHGQSEGNPRAYVPDLDVFVDDLAILWKRLKTEYPQLPRFVFAHSMGGLIGTRFALRHQAEMAGLITSAAALLLGDSISPVMIALGKVIARISPRMPMQALDSRFISRDPKVVRLYDQDPLCFRGKVRAKMGLSIIQRGAETRQNLAQLTLPLLILHGSADKIVKPEASRLLYANAASTDKTLKMYEGLYHEVVNEPEKERVINDMLEWLNYHCVIQSAT